MASRMFMGIDVSTTSVKALLIDERGKVVSVASTEQDFSTPHPLWAEQDPRIWWENTIISIQAALQSAHANGDEIAAIGLTGQMHGLVLLDGEDQVLRPAILWNDQRTGKQCEEITQAIGAERLIRICGNKALTGFTAPKILWVRENEPRVYEQVRHVLLPKDYVRLRLTGAYAMDKADGSGTILFDLAKRDWSGELLDDLSIAREWMPPTFEGPEITGEVSPEAARLTGLKAGTPVMAGGGDQAAGAVGMGAVHPGAVSLTLGTSGVVFAPTGEPFIEPVGRLHAFCHALPGTWHLMGVMLSAAGSLRWFRDTLALGMSYDQITAKAGAVPPGCEGLLFLPYLTGERTPHPDPLARGAFVGLTLRHTIGHMARSVLEGVAFGLRDSMELLRGAGLAEVAQVRVSGGGAKSPLWRQILADVLGVELVTVNTTEGAAYGAAILAGTGAGNWGSVSDASRAAVSVVDSTQPDAAQVARYQPYYEQYRALYPALRPTFNALAQE